MSKLKLKVSTIGEHEVEGAKFTFNIIPEAEYTALLSFKTTGALLERALVSFSGITIDADDGVIESPTRDQLTQYPAAAYFVSEIYREFWLKNARSLTLKASQELGQG